MCIYYVVYAGKVKLIFNKPCEKKWWLQHALEKSWEDTTSKFEDEIFADRSSVKVSPYNKSILPSTKCYYYVLEAWISDYTSIIVIYVY